MDLETIKKLTVRDEPKIIMGLGNKFYLDEQSQKNSIELDWDQSYEVQGLVFTFLECQHWSKRGLTDNNKSLWGAFAIQGSKKSLFCR